MYVYKNEMLRGIKSMLKFGIHSSSWLVSTNQRELKSTLISKPTHEDRLRAKSVNSYGAVIMVRDDVVNMLKMNSSGVLSILVFVFSCTTI